MTKSKASEIRKSMPLLSIGTVMKLTDLSARQIRYYEEHGLIQPHRTEGNRRMYSLNDVDTLLEIKDLLEQGINMAGIKRVFEMKKENNMKKDTKSEKEISKEELRRVMREEIWNAQRMHQVSLRHGDLSRFYQN